MSQDEDARRLSFWERMGMTATQAGNAGEELFAACVTITSDGQLELYRPLSDDDQTDVGSGASSSARAC